MRRITLFVALLALALPISGAIIKTSTVQNSDDTHDTKYPAGDKPGGGGTGIKYHPGFYPTYYPRIPNPGGHGYYELDDPGIQDLLEDYIADVVCPDASIAGVRVFADWASLEGDTHGDYTAGIARVRAIVDQLYACSSGHKRLQLTPMLTCFCAAANYLVIWPAYFVQSSAGGTDSVGTYGIVEADFPGVTAQHMKIWTTAGAAAYTDLVEAYAAEFDTDPGFEMWEMGIETSYNLNTGTGGFSYANLATQLAVIFPAMRTAFAHSGLRFGANWGPNDSYMESVLALAATYAIGIGGPDTVPHDDVQAFYIFSGETGTDYRGVIPAIAEVQDPSMCDGKASKPGANAANNYTYPDFYNHTVSGNPTPVGLDGGLPGIRAIYPSYYVWLVYLSDSCSDADQAWGGTPPNWIDSNTGGARDFIQTSPTVNTTCPSAYTAFGGCDGP